MALAPAANAVARFRLNGFENVLDGRIPHWPDLRERSTLEYAIIGTH